MPARNRKCLDQAISYARLLHPVASGASEDRSPRTPATPAAVPENSIHQPFANSRTVPSFARLNRERAMDGMLVLKIE